MKKISTFLVGICLSCLSLAQNVSDLKIFDAVTVTGTTFPAFNFSADAEKLIAQIVEIVGLKPNFTVKPGNVKNAAATVRNGKRLIRYNPDFIDQMNEKGINTWTYVFIIAHEVGHHLNGHTIQKGKKEISAELEADEFAGFILKKMGATLLQARTAVSQISSTVSTRTHPGSSDRVEAVEKGWTNANQ